VYSRAQWLAERLELEERRGRTTPTGYKAGRFSQPIINSIKWAEIPLKLLGAYVLGRRNALNIRVARQTVEVKGLHGDLDGLNILHISDLHVDFDPEAVDVTVMALADIEADICFITGDFLSHPQREANELSGQPSRAIKDIRRIISSINSRHGIFATLGNHDSASLVKPLEDMGVQLLINESITLGTGPGQLHVTGTDDVHRFYTPAAIRALTAAVGGLKIALVHTADLAEIAAEKGYDLYLAGHTHGGQICLPGGRVIFSFQDCGRAYASGYWRRGAMHGYTTTGVGTGILPLRFNSRGEIALLKLVRK